MKFCIGYMCHIVTPETIYRYEKIKNDISKIKGENEYTLYWILQDDTEIDEKLNFDYPYNITINRNIIKNKFRKTKYVFEVTNPLGNDEEVDIDLEQYCNTGFHFNTILNYVEFYHQLPNFDYYWFIEYDLILNGDWKMFFEKIDDNNSDYIAEHIKENYDKTNYHIVHVSKFVKYNLKDYPKQYTSMLCICRFSNNLIKELYDYYLYEYGFMENLIPTFCYYNEYTFKDINNIFYCYEHTTRNNGTIAWGGNNQANIITTHNLFLSANNILYHPIKEDKMIYNYFDGCR